VEWKITNDTRDIAGFECKKATAIIMDSVYIIAFYTDQITCSGGPLSFCNLPGMILGIAIPRCNVSIFATKVEMTEPLTAKLIPPISKKKATYKTLEATLQKALEQWGTWGKKYIINYLL
jgi:GLPGLI family protein